MKMSSLLTITLLHIFSFLQPSVMVSSEGCQKKGDIVFVIDTSHDYDAAKFKKTIRFVEHVVSTFDIAPDKIRVGMVLYSTNSFSPFDLDDYQEMEPLKKAINKVHHTPGKTNTPAALQRAYYILTSNKTGARLFTDAQHIIILMSASTSTTMNKMYYSDYLIKEALIEVYTIGIGSTADYKQLNQLASYPRYQHRFMIDSYDALSSLAKTFSKNVCSNIYEPGELVRPRYFRRGMPKKFSNYDDLKKFQDL